MKPFLISAILTLLCFTTTISQTNPQYVFNSESNYASVINGDNDYQNYMLRWFLITFDKDLSSKDILQICYQMYIYEHTSMIIYATVDEKPLLFRTSSDTSVSSQKIPVDFGSSLESMDENEEGFSLYFASPVTKIDPAIFSLTTKYISFPHVDNLEYQASAFSCVKNLSHLKGKDVINNRLLVSKSGELIIAAVAGLTYYNSIPNQVTKIGAGAFRGCTLQVIHIPENVNYIGDKAFDLCDNLTSVYLYAHEPVQISPSAFSNDKSMKYKIFVPKKTYKEYRNKYPSLKKRIKPFNN